MSAYKFKAPEPDAPTPPRVVVARGSDLTMLPKPWTYWCSEGHTTWARAPLGTPLLRGWTEEGASPGSLAFEAPLAFDRLQAAAAAILTPGLDCSVVVLREDQGRWLVSLGVGRLGGQGNLPGSYPNPWEAKIGGSLACKARRAEEVATIRQCRGGRLDWGEPIEEFVEPIVLYPKRGETAFAARLRYYTEQGLVAPGQKP